MVRETTAIILLVMTLWGSPWQSTRPAILVPPHPPSIATLTTPPECVTLTALTPQIVPSWVFVMNFDVISPTVPSPTPIGCILVFRTPGVATDFISVPCDVFGAVTFAAGTAQFNGGNVRCNVNLKDQLAALNPPIVLQDTALYPYLELIGTGILNVPTPITDTLGNPIAYYEPLSPTMPAAGLFVPPTSSDSFVMTSLFNGVANKGSVNFPQGALTPHTWVAKHNGFGATFTVSHVLDGNVLQTYSPRQPVLFWQNGGVFWFGGSPLGPSFDGSLDEAIVDPPDGGRPPSHAMLPIVSGSGAQ